MTEERKSVMVGNSECMVETLVDWLTHRIKMLMMGAAPGHEGDFGNDEAWQRSAELRIIWDKINDGRIQEIGKVQFKSEMPSYEEILSDLMDIRALHGDGRFSPHHHKHALIEIDKTIHRARGKS